MMSSNLLVRGTVQHFGDDVNTDVLHPSRFFSLDRLTVQSGFAFRDQNADASADAQTATIVVAGRNFGYGSSRETTIQSLMANGVSGVVASSINRIFWRNAINAGLPVMNLADAPAILASYAVLHVDFEQGRVLDEQGAQIAKAIPLDAYDQEVLKAGGILNWLRQEQSSNA